MLSLCVTVLKAGTENENLRMARAEKAEKTARARAAAAEASAADAERKTNALAGMPGKEQVAVPSFINTTISCATRMSALYREVELPIWGPQSFG